MTLRDFQDDVLRFLKIMQDSRNSIEYIDNAFECLFHVFLLATTTGQRMDEKDIPKAQTTMEAITQEWMMRKMYLSIGPLTRPA